MCQYFQLPSVTTQTDEQRHRRARTNMQVDLQMSAREPFSLPALRWVVPRPPLSQQAREHAAEETALSAVEKAIPSITHAGAILHQVPHVLCVCLWPDGVAVTPSAGEP